MIRMVNVKKQSVTFCKYIIAGTLWIAVFTGNAIPVYIIFFIMLASGVLGIKNAPLVKLFDLTFAKRIRTEEVYINMYSMRFAHLFACVFCVFSILSYHFISQIIFIILTLILAVLQTIASFGYCSAQKLYECVVCNSNCCRFGKKVRSMKKNVR